MRPQTLDEVVGQQHLLGENGILRKIVAKKEPDFSDFWGRLGVGKTTLSRIIAREVEADFIEISAVTSGKRHRARRGASSPKLEFRNSNSSLRRRNSPLQQISAGRFFAAHRKRSDFTNRRDH